MRSAQALSRKARPAPSRSKRVLNAGSGASSTRRLHKTFQRADWEEVRLDIDPNVEPDLVGSVTDLSALVPSGAFDAAWASHSLEHLHAHEVLEALAEFRRILKPDGFALITSPDLETVATLMLQHGLDYVVYTSPMGPITTHDMLFGHAESIRRGMTYMAHNSGFTCDRLGSLLLQAGFPMALAKRNAFEVWALALMEDADQGAILNDLKAAGLDMFDQAE